MYPLLDKGTRSSVNHGERRQKEAVGDGAAEQRETMAMFRPGILEGTELWSVAGSTRSWSTFHPTYTLCVPRRLAGRQLWRCDGINHELGLTTTLLLQPGALAVATADSPVDLDFLLVPAALMDRALAAVGTRAAGTEASDAAGAPPLSRNVLIDDNGLVAAFDHLRRALESPAPEPHEQKARLEALLRVLIDKVLPLPPPPALTPSRCSRALDRVREVIHQRYAERITLDDLAMDTGFSKFYLERSFNERFGVPIHQFLKRVRIGMALAMMRGGARPSSVARTVGFADQPHMTRVFRDELGITPRTYWAASRAGDAPRSRKAGPPAASP